MRLIGAKEFLKTVKPGTLFIQYWKSNANECKEIIRDFEKGVDITKKYYGGYHLFGDNGGSLTFLLSDEPDMVTIDDKEMSFTGIATVYEQSIISAFLESDEGYELTLNFSDYEPGSDTLPYTASYKINLE